MESHVLNCAPESDCAQCPRLVAFRETNRAAFPDWHNAPVATFCPTSDDPPVKLLIVGLAPGLRGANRTSRPFTGDYAGDLLYATLGKFGLSRGTYDARPDDGLDLVGCQITNSVRCVPPQNKPVGAEIAACRPFLANTIKALPDLRAILALGTIAHGTVLSALKLRKAIYPFGHGAIHTLPDGIFFADSYHCSRYNTNTRRLTTEMFESVFEKLAELIAD
ncbi:MAG: uracil-DNA glycosylase [Rhodospirillales bacterium]|nr:uracil-DNA glycosylase [Alphaproteobacteria bacterium]MBL6928291.1 uracil-DNA glycosylase [Rhodospirillales bacterium]